MQKKIVAAICAAALALAMPVAAFAADTIVSSNGTATIAGTVKGSNDNVTLSNISFTGVNGSVEKIKVDKAGATGAAPSNALPGSVSSFAIQAKDKDWDNELVKGLGQYAIMNAEVTFNDAVIRDLPSSIAGDNLYVGGKFTSATEGTTVTMDTFRVNAELNTPESAITAAAGTASVQLEGLGTGTLTLWMQNGKYSAGDNANAAAVADEAKDGSKSPKTGELL